MGFQPTGKTVAQCEKERRKVYKSGLRIIDQSSGFRAVVGSLRGLMRQIERGEHGDVRNIVVVLSHETSGLNSPSVSAFHYGAGSVADAHWMLSTAKNRIEPA